MQIVPLAIDELVAVDSCYRLSGQHRALSEPPLATSIARIGLIEPIVVHELANGERHILDGVARWAAVREIEQTHIAACLLSPQTDPSELMRLYFLAHRSRVMVSAVNRVRFLDLAKQTGVTSEALRDEFLPLVGFDAHDRLARRCATVAELPGPVLDFCHEKRFSLKQCVHLTRHPVELLELLFQWRDRLALTASIVGELAEHIRDYLRASDLQVAEFADLPIITEVMQNDASPQERTAALRRVVRKLRFPMLTEIQTTLESIRGDMRLPKGVELRWDPTLEQKALELRIRLHDEKCWPETIKRLASAETEAGLHALLERL